MIITGADLYWITRLDSFIAAGHIVSIVLGIFALAATIISLISWGEGGEKKPFFICFPILVLCALLLVGVCFIPSTKEMCAIKVIPMIANDQEVQELPNKVLDLANGWLDELKPQKSTEGEN